jgi:hypothetical protein
MMSLVPGPKFRKLRFQMIADNNSAQIRRKSGAPPPISFM